MNASRIQFFAFNLLIGLLISSASAQAQYSITITKDIPYAGNTNSMQNFTICKPIGAPTPMPVLVVIHGGGWVQGDKTGILTATACNRYAKKGYFVANINYRTVTGYSETGPIPNPNLGNTFAAALLDSQLVVRFLKSKASTYKIDQNRMCALGFSAGAHLASFLGVLKTNYPGDVSGQLSTHSPAVNCVASHAGPADLTTAIYGVPNSDNYMPMKSFVNKAATSENEAFYRDASPYHHMAADAAPMHFTHGQNDDVVFPQQSQLMFNKLQGFQIPSAQVYYNGGHVYLNMAAGEKSMWTYIDESVTWAFANAR